MYLKHEHSIVEQHDLNGICFPSDFETGRIITASDLRQELRPSTLRGVSHPSMHYVKRNWFKNDASAGDVQCQGLATAEDGSRVYALFTHVEPAPFPSSIPYARSLPTEDLHMYVDHGRYGGWIVRYDVDGNQLLETPYTVPLYGLNGNEFLCDYCEPIHRVAPDDEPTSLSEVMSIISTYGLRGLSCWLDDQETGLSITSFRGVLYVLFPMYYPNYPVVYSVLMAFSELDCRLLGTGVIGWLSANPMQDYNYFQYIPSKLTILDGHMYISSFPYFSIPEYWKIWERFDDDWEFIQEAKEDGFTFDQFIPFDIAYRERNERRYITKYPIDTLLSDLSAGTVFEPAIINLTYEENDHFRPLTTYFHDADTSLDWHKFVLNTENGKGSIWTIQYHKFKIRYGSDFIDSDIVSGHRDSDSWGAVECKILNTADRTALAHLTLLVSSESPMRLSLNNSSWSTAISIGDLLPDQEATFYVYYPNSDEICLTSELLVYHVPVV